MNLMNKNAVFESQSSIKLSIVVICYNMQREILLTLRSLLPPYQLGVDFNDIEIIVVDNGSTQEIDLTEFKNKVRFFQYEKPTQSPAAAINFGINKAQSDLIGVFIDGARMASPGLCREVIQANRLSNRVIISTIAYHLGPGVQMNSVFKGYNRELEDQLLKKIDWYNNGYDLFQISTLAGSSARGLFQPISETNALFMSRNLWLELDGFDEKFVTPGGGLVNLDTYKRACELEGTELVMLLSESTFHQVHGGIATNQRRGKNWQQFSIEYTELRGEKFSASKRLPKYFGQYRPQTKHLMKTSLAYTKEPENNINLSSVNTLLKKYTDGLIYEHLDNSATFDISDFIDAPILIIGRGGSGTRLLSKLIQDVGIFLGNDLNESEDSLEWVKPIYDLVINQKRVANKRFSNIECEDLRRNALNILLAKGIKNIKHWGFKLPETMLCLPELLQAFPKAKVIHLVRHPVSICLRRSHMTSRLDNAVGRSVLNQAYQKLGIDFEKSSNNSEEINNAISWEFQLSNVKELAVSRLNKKNYVEVKYENICLDTNKVKIGLYEFLKLDQLNCLESSVFIDSSRINHVTKDMPYYDEVWEICGKTASLFGYEKYEI